MPKWKAVFFGKFKKQCGHKLEFGLTRALSAYHCDLQKHKETYCAERVCPLYNKAISIQSTNATYGISRYTGCIVKFPVRVTGWLSDNEYILLDHYPSEHEYFYYMPECVKQEASATLKEVKKCT